MQSEESGVFGRMYTVSTRLGNVCVKAGAHSLLPCRGDIFVCCWVGDVAWLGLVVRQGADPAPGLSLQMEGKQTTD